MRFACICIICFSIASCKKHDDTVTTQQNTTTDTSKPTDTTLGITSTSIIYYGTLNTDGSLEPDATVKVTYRSNASKDNTITFSNDPFDGTFTINPQKQYDSSAYHLAFHYVLRGDSLYATKTAWSGDIRIWSFNGKRK